MSWGRNLLLVAVLTFPCAEGIADINLMEPRKNIDLSPRAVLRRVVRWAFTLLVVLVVVVAAFYLEENWRGRSAWNKYKHQLEKQGERLDWAAYVEKPVPDEENFVRTPLLESAANKNYSEQPAWAGLAERARRFVIHLGDWTAGKRTDLEACERELIDNPGESGATNVLGDFKDLEPALDDLRKAAHRRYAQFPVPLTNPWDAQTVRFPAIRQLVQVIAVHASAELAANHPERALEDIQALSKVAEALRSQPTLVSAMIRVAILGGPGTQPIWEGIVGGKWSDAQLEQFQRQYAAIDLLPDLQRSVRGGERATINDLIENNPQQVRKLLIDSHGDKGKDRPWKEVAFDWAVRVSPSGWGYQNRLFYNRIIQDYILNSVDTKLGPISPRAIKSSGSQFEKELHEAKLFGLLAAIAVPNFHRAIQVSVRNQTYFNELVIACALERYRRANGQYPQTMEELVPKFLEKIPRELIENQSFKYEKEDDTHFLLYSIGWDQKDDGGTTASDRDHGDWVWHSTVR